MKLKPIDEKVIELVEFTANELCRLKYPDYQITPEDVKMVLQATYLIADIIKLKDKK